LKDSKLFRSFQLPRFTQAFAFMCEVAFLAEKNNHHPEWFNVYGRVDISLTTHQFDGISSRDFELATTIDKLASDRQAQ
ncbi:MAG: 4a-hydroxytetrahydrobiopterin dehydratase, partial [Granulosicoccus sp.]